MSVYIHQIETLQPPNHYRQEAIAAALKRSVAKGDRRTERVIHHIYAQSAIDQRASVVTDFVPNAPAGIFYDPSTDSFLSPTTGVRNARYTDAAQAMFPEIAATALTKSGFAVDQLTHLVTVSCTGFFQPGPDFAILKALGLTADVERYHLGFMGCYAAFPALRMARDFCRANPEAVVLVVCLELCSLHVQWTAALDDLLAGSVFADGASAAVVSARPPNGPALRLDAFASAIAPADDADMAWTIGDNGFAMRLSASVPRIIEAHVRGSLQKLLDRTGQTQDSVGHWAVYPGGRAILDRVEAGLELSETALSVSRDILRRCGNMSSATILFVLRELLDRGAAVDDTVLAMAFGPGLTVETALLSVA